MERHLFFLLIFIGISSLTFSQNFSRSKKSKINVEKFVLAQFTDAIDSDSIGDTLTIYGSTQSIVQTCEWYDGVEDCQYDYDEIIEKMESFYLKNNIQNILLVVNKSKSFDKKLKGDFNLDSKNILNFKDKNFI